ncbi:MAG: hypothetical protein EBU90_28625, partial [Proteobacteria bacterium]|nr:hypothetical protein [Pseudomonadota bacterium]
MLVVPQPLNTTAEIAADIRVNLFIKPPSNKKSSMRIVTHTGFGVNQRVLCLSHSFTDFEKFAEIKVSGLVDGFHCFFGQAC